MPQIFRAIVATLGATRYLVLLLLLLSLVGYGLLTIGGYVPFYGEVAARLRVAPVVLLGLVFGLIVLLVTVGWYGWVLHPEAPLDTMLSVRFIYRQSDRSGLLIYDALLLLLLLGVVLVVPRLFTNEYLRGTTYFLVGITILVFLFDFWPAGRPRRLVGRFPLAVAGGAETSLDRIVRDLATTQAQTDEETIRETLRLYNDLDRLLPTAQDPQHPLPPGIVLEIPPRF